MFYSNPEDEFYLEEGVAAGSALGHLGALGLRRRTPIFMDTGAAKLTASSGAEKLTQYGAKLIAGGTGKTRNWEAEQARQKALAKARADAAAAFGPQRGGYVRPAPSVPKLPAPRPVTPTLPKPAPLPPMTFTTPPEMAPKPAPEYPDSYQESLRQQQQATGMTTPVQQPVPQAPVYRGIQYQTAQEAPSSYSPATKGVSQGVAVSAFGSGITKGRTLAPISKCTVSDSYRKFTEKMMRKIFSGVPMGVGELENVISRSNVEISRLLNQHRRVQNYAGKAACMRSVASIQNTINTLRTQRAKVVAKIMSDRVAAAKAKATGGPPKKPIKHMTPEREQELKDFITSLEVSAKVEQEAISTGYGTKEKVDELKREIQGAKDQLVQGVLSPETLPTGETVATGFDARPSEFGPTWGGGDISTPVFTGDQLPAPTIRPLDAPSVGPQGAPPEPYIDEFGKLLPPPTGTQKHKEYQAAYGSENRLDAAASNLGKQVANTIKKVLGLPRGEVVDVAQDVVDPSAEVHAGLDALRALGQKFKEVVTGKKPPHRADVVTFVPGADAVDVPQYATLFEHISEREEAMALMKTPKGIEAGAVTAGKVLAEKGKELSKQAADVLAGNEKPTMEDRVKAMLSKVSDMTDDARELSPEKAIDPLKGITEINAKEWNSLLGTRGFATKLYDLLAKNLSSYSDFGSVISSHEDKAKAEWAKQLLLKNLKGSTIWADLSDARRPLQGPAAISPAEAQAAGLRVLEFAEDLGHMGQNISVKIGDRKKQHVPTHRVEALGKKMTWKGARLSVLAQNAGIDVKTAREKLARAQLMNDPSRNVHYPGRSDFETREQLNNNVDAAQKLVKKMEVKFAKATRDSNKWKIVSKAKIREFLGLAAK